jgi:hypothetical protein
MGVRILIDSLDTARFACPECGQGKIMQLSEYIIRKPCTRVKCTCRCGHTYMVTLEKKIEPIHDTQLLGTFVSTSDEQSGKMIIKKLNSRGLVFRTNIDHNLLPGLRLVLEFVLDDAKQSIVKKEVKVKAKKGRYLTVEFTSHDHPDNLGPYLTFHNL